MLKLVVKFQFQNFNYYPFDKKKEKEQFLSVLPIWLIYGYQKAIISEIRQNFLIHIKVLFFTAKLFLMFKGQK